MNEIRAEDWTTIGRFQEGDQAAFDELMRRHWQRANSYACKLTKDRDEAADVVADTFYRVFRSLNRFRGESSFTSWLYRIELNCFLDIRKKLQSRMSLSLDELLCGRDGQATLQVVDGQDSAQERLERRERITAIEKAMKNLSPNQSQAFMMFHGDAMCYEDISKALSVPIGTVKSRLNRARLQVRKTIRTQRLQALEATKIYATS